MTTRTTSRVAARVGARFAASAVAGALAVTAAACGSETGTTETGRFDAPSMIDAEVGAATVAAGELSGDDLNEPSAADPWRVADWDEAGEDVAACLDLAGGEGDAGVVASGASTVFESDDERGPTSIFVTAQSTTVAYGTADEAAAAFGVIDETTLAECVAESTDANVLAGEEGESVEPVDPETVEVDEVRPVDAGDEALALRATYDQEFGDGDDNASAVELQAVRVGPVVTLVLVTRDGEDQADGVVDAETLGLTDVVGSLAARVTTALEAG